MKNFLKYATVGVAGYFIGFYEMKYKVLKAVANEYVKQNHEKEDSKEETEEEA